MSARRVHLCFGSIAAAFVFGSLVAPSDVWSAIFQAALLALTSAATVVGPKLHPPPSRRGLSSLTAAMLVATASRLAEFVAPPAGDGVAPSLWVGLLPMVAF